mmetsp:Transcript_66291/g.176577  ORF Transcript_66291/g.176577 Transcript_66291/m.176577 type:complete len:443 (-) Transcript_66291:119-1447(-)
MWRLPLCLAAALQGSAVLGGSISDETLLLQQHLAADAILSFDDGSVAVPQEEDGKRPPKPEADPVIDGGDDEEDGGGDGEEEGQRPERRPSTPEADPVIDDGDDEEDDSSKVSGPSCMSLDDSTNSKCVGEVEWGSRVGKLQDKASKWYADMQELINVSYTEGTKEDFQRYWYCKGFLYVKASESDKAKACTAPPCTCSSPPCDICLPLKVQEVVQQESDEDLEQLDMTIDEYVRERLWERVQELGKVAVDKSINVTLQLSEDAGKHVKQAIRDMSSTRLKGSRMLKYKLLTKLSKQRMVGIEKLSKRLSREHLKNVKRFKDHEDAIHHYEKNRKDRDAHYEKIYKARTEGKLTDAEAEEAAYQAGNTPEEEAKRLHDIYKRHHDHDVWVQHKMQTQIDNQERADRLKRRAQYEAEHPNDEVRDDEDKPGYIDGILDDGSHR